MWLSLNRKKKPIEKGKKTISAPGDLGLNFELNC